jgi:hypothetical protein
MPINEHQEYEAMSNQMAVPQSSPRVPDRPSIGHVSEDVSLLGRRDAFHVPAVLVTCDIYIEPGESVVFENSLYKKVRRAVFNETRHGLVDPFISMPAPGKLFWVLLVPGAVENLVHQFEINTDAPASPAEAVSDSTEDDDDGSACGSCY